MVIGWFSNFFSLYFFFFSFFFRDFEYQFVWVWWVRMALDSIELLECPACTHQSTRSLVFSLLLLFIYLFILYCIVELYVILYVQMGFWFSCWKYMWLLWWNLNLREPKNNDSVKQSNSINETQSKMKMKFIKQIDPWSKNHYKNP